MNFQDFLQNWIAEESVSTEDVFSCFIPLAREVIEAHRADRVAPLEGLQALNVENGRIWFPEDQRQPLRQNLTEIARLERAAQYSVEVLAETRRVADITASEDIVSRLDIAERGNPLTRPVYLAGYVAWEHEVQHHDPLTDVFSLGLLLASLACQLNLNEPDRLELLVSRRRNLFALNSNLHPALAQAIYRMTELDPRAGP
jgi:hypothetical protein